jgi:ATP-dependent Clp protease ATP-binding subunit ClpX
MAFVGCVSKANKMDWQANLPPTPEEFQRRLRELLKATNMGMPGVAGAAAGQPAAEEGGGDVKVEEKDKGFEFEAKPKDVKKHLDRFVIRQEEAKKVLSVALCDHYNAVRMARGGRDSTQYVKQNILLLGPTGVGKTYLIRSMAELIGVPFVKADATKFSETGYVGGDVEDLVRDLVRRADGDVKRAEYGIIYLDEVDKLAVAPGATGRDVSGRGVQTNLLKLMEETEVSVRAPNDIAGQFQAFMDMSQGRGKKQPMTVNTRHILFVMSGAFGDMEPIIRKRLRESSIGFAARTDRVPEAAGLLEEAKTRDFMDFGLEPEFVGRLPVRVVCHGLEEEDLFLILKNSEGSIVRQYEQSFGAYGIEVLFRDDGLREIAHRAVEEKTGARGLMTVCERTFRNLKFELPSTALRRFVVTRDLVANPDGALAELREESAREEKELLREVVREYARRFEEAHGLKMVFTAEAEVRLIALSAELGCPVREVCAVRFKDYQFGLKLVAQNTGQREFVLDEGTVEAPDRFLSDMVVKSYRDKPGGEAADAGEA